ncbi:unnamed protein product, partial [Ectocarpus fasciculatus]
MEKPPQPETEHGTGGSQQQLFEATVGRVSRWTGPAVATQDQLVLYGLYKQASFGDCHSQRPGLFDPTGRAKWNSWKSCEGLGGTEAMQRYCRVADAVCPENRAAGFGKAAGDDDQHDDVDREPQAVAAAAGNGREAEVSAPRHANSSNRNSSSSDGGETDSAGRHVEPTAATRGAGERSTERLRRRAGRGAGGDQTDDRRSAERSWSAGRGAGAIGGGGIGAAGVGKVGVAVALALVVALARRGDRGAREVQEEGTQLDDDSLGWSSVWYELGAWWVAWTVFALFSVLSAAAAAAWCLWCAVRVARWREEIFAGSPVVPEALSRATAAAAATTLGPGVRAGRDSGDGSSSSRTSSIQRGDDCGGITGELGPGGEACAGDDPVGYLFRPGTRASRDFCVPPLMSDAGSVVRGGCRSVNGGCKAAAISPPVEGSGAVVFLTGVTGLVGQMVLFDLLRQGTAVSSGGSSAENEDGEGAAAGLGERGLGGSAPGGLRAVVVLVRGKKGVAPSDRLSSIRDSAMFRPLRESGAWVDEETDTPAAERASPLPCPPSREALGLPQRKRRGAVVVAVEGELGEEGLGLSAESRALLAGAGVTHALHCAASVSFSDPLAEAAATNVTGALRVAALVASWPSCGTLIHVSTAFVHGGNSGTASCPLPQELPDLGGRSPERLYRSAQRAPSGSDSGGGGTGGSGGAGKEALDAMADLGYPNTYTFTKALGEHLLVKALSAHNRRLDMLAATAASAEESDDGEAGGRLATAAAVRGSCTTGDSCGSPGPCRLRLRVVRPSIVGPAWVFPWPGWTGEQPSTVTGCQVLVLQRAVKTFRLGPHPAPIIPVDVVSRAIVHSALGWGGPLTSSSPTDTPAANVMAAMTDIPGSPAAESRPDVVIRNLAWATHPVLAVGGSGAMVGRKRDTAVGSGGGGVAREGGGKTAVVTRRTGERTAVGGGGREGRMPSFREISGLLYDYAVLRGMRPSLEALAMRSSFAAASLSPPVAATGTACGGGGGGGGGKGGGSSSSPSCPQSPSGGRGDDQRGLPPTAGGGGFQGGRDSGLLLLRGGGLKPSLPRLAFDAMHLLLDRSPVWALQGLAALAERVGVFGNNGYRQGGRGRDGRRRTGVAVTLRRLDKLAALPAVYETFTWQEYFFDSALRVPEGLKPAGYALETALASELLQRSLPGGAEEGAKASPERRRSILRELGLQIRTHRTGGLRCGGRGNDTGTSLRVNGAPNGNRVAAGEEEDGGGGGGGGRPLNYNGDDVETNGVVKNSDDEAGGAGERLTRRRRRRPLSVLCGRADRLVPWPALAWWAATLPGSAARGGVTLWVRLVAFAVRVVMSRAASTVAVDVDSFREAAPPGHGVAADGTSRGRSKEDRAATAPGVRGEAAGGGGGDDGGDAAVGNNGGEKSAAGAGAAGADGGDGWRAGGCGGRAGAGSGREGEGDGKVVVVLLPTHRSYLDFVLVSLFCASMRSFPGLSWLRVPKVAAADGPFGKEGTPLRWLMGKLGAFFIRRGQHSEPHSDLRRRLEALQEGASGEGETSQKVPSGEEGIACDGSKAATRDEAGDSRGTSGNERTRDHPQAGFDGNGGGSAEGGGCGGRWPGPCESDPCQRGLETLEVFVEGTRSRDRRFLAPKTGLIRALQGAREGATLWLVPVSISYERVPEQGRLAEELLSRGCSREAGGATARGQHSVGAVGLTGLLRWTMKALSGRVRLGRVLMRAGEPVALNPGGNVKAALLEVRRRHRSGTVVTPYHVREASEHLGLEEGDVRECIHELGGTVWEGDVDDGIGEWSEKACPMSNPQPLPTPTSTSTSTSRYASDVPSVERLVSSASPASDDMEAWMNHLQWVHLLHDRLRSDGRRDGGDGDSSSSSSSRSSSRWAEWLVPSVPLSSKAAASTAAASAARLAARREENEHDKGGVLGQPSTLWLSDSSANGGADADAGVAGDTAAATVAETARNSPRSTESSSASSSPSWVMATGASTSSCSSSSTPSSFELTSSLDDDGAAPCTATTAASSPSSFEITPPEDTATPSLETTPSVYDGHSHGDGEGSVANYSRRNDEDDVENQGEPALFSSEASRRVLAAVLREFNRAESAVAEARAALVERGFSRPSPGHVLQVLVRNANEGGEWRGGQEPGSSEDEEGARLEVRGCSGAVRGAPSLFLASVALSLGCGGDDPRGNNAERNGADSAAIDGASEADFKNASAATAAAAGFLSVSRRSGRGEHEPTSAVEDDDGWFGAVDGDKEAAGSWGFRDSGFCIESDRSDGANPFVVMRGNRYGICGRPLRGLLPFVREAIGVPISAEGRARRAASPPPPSLPPSRLLKPKPSSLDVGRGATKPASDVGSGGTGDCLGRGRVHESAGLGGGQQSTLLESMVEALGLGFEVKEQVSLSRQERARHGAGHGLSDIWSLRSGKMRRSPDAVVWPTSEDQVSRLMEWAGEEGVCLIPFGGGTSVTRALEVPPLDVEPRPVVSVDMRKASTAMDHVLDVDVANGTAHIQAGAVGRKLAAELAEKGVTTGHEPDSLEFSTLGGWVATRASGMKRGRYGNIEDMVLEVRVVTGKGLAWQHSDRGNGRTKAPGAFSRTSVGLDLASAMLGSEGCLGIITSVVVKIVPLPQVSEHASFLFRDFQTGVAFCRELSRCSGRLGLASCRLLDNRQLRLGKAMKGDEDDVSGGLRPTLKSLVPKAQSAYIRLWKGWGLKETSAVTMVFEGSQQEAALQRREV